MEATIMENQMENEMETYRGYIEVKGDYYRCYNGESNGKENGR